MNTRNSLFCGVVAFLAMAFMIGASAQDDNVEGEQQCVPSPDLSLDPVVEIDCVDMFEGAHRTLAAAFESVTADDGCGEDLTDRIRVEKMHYVARNGDYYAWLKLDEIAAEVEAFGVDEYDYTIKKTQKLFHYNFLFKPGEYEIHYHIRDVDEDGAVLDTWIDDYDARFPKQVIFVGDDCKGCLGFLGCDSCAGCREDYIHVNGLDLKRLLGDWLLIGLSALVMLSWSAVQRR